MLSHTGLIVPANVRISGIAGWTVSPACVELVISLTDRNRHRKGPSLCVYDYRPESIEAIRALKERTLEAYEKLREIISRPANVHVVMTQINEAGGPEHLELHPLGAEPPTALLYTGMFMRDDRKGLDRQQTAQIAVDESLWAWRSTESESLYKMGMTSYYKDTAVLVVLTDDTHQVVLEHDDNFFLVYGGKQKTFTVLGADVRQVREEKLSPRQKEKTMFP